jgi:hypothetical protein
MKIAFVNRLFACIMRLQVVDHSALARSGKAPKIRNPECYGISLPYWQYSKSSITQTEPETLPCFA